jgi:hypothetical protein
MSQFPEVNMCVTYRVIEKETYVKVEDLITFFDDASFAYRENENVHHAMTTVMGMLIRLNREARNGSGNPA